MKKSIKHLPLFLPRLSPTIALLLALLLISGQRGQASALRHAVAMRVPELGDAQMRVDAVHQRAQRARIFSPRGVVNGFSAGGMQWCEVQCGGQFRVLEFMDEGNRAGFRIRQQRMEQCAERAGFSLAPVAHLL